ncbi:MAG: hypothetical protein HYV97_10780 [Bdellovibrio sp.]|nr:hypothetical protein [Bdellovibrio sp.]
MDDSTLVSKVGVAPHSKWSHLLHFAKISTLIFVAVLVILMIIGTLAEGYGGADFANRLIFSRWYFLGPFLFIFLYLIGSLGACIPLQRRLIGSYLIQLGFILLGVEFLMTSWNGEYGTMTLLPHASSDEVMLDEDIITITYEDKDHQSGHESISFNLPNSAFTSKLHDAYRDVALTTFIPFSGKVLTWAYPSGQGPGTFSSSQYQIKTTGAGTHLEFDVVLSQHPEAKEFLSVLNVPPVSIQYLPEEVTPCFDRIGASKIILWDIQSKVCFTPEEQKIAIQRPVVGKRFMAIKRDHEFHSFFPDFSPYPLTQDLNPIKTSPLRVMALNNFEDAQHLFLMGPKLAFIKEGVWVTESLMLERPQHIPNLMLEITLLHHTVEKIPMLVPQFIYPKQQQGQLATGKVKAVEVLIQGRTYWVTNEMPLQLEVSKKLITLQLKKKTIKLPYHVSVSQVHHDGASLHFNGPEHNGHYLVSMNHPLQIDGVTFYRKEKSNGDQANAAVLTVNFSPSHPLKYFALMMALVGLILYFLLQNTGEFKTQEAQKGPLC